MSIWEQLKDCGATTQTEPLNLDELFKQVYAIRASGRWSFEFYRRPRSKKKRVIKRWMNRWENWRQIP